MNYSGQRVLVLGLGLTGLSAALWLRKRGADVVVADTRETPPRLDMLLARAPEVPVVLGGLDSTLVDKADLVVISPGLNINAPDMAAARARKVPFVGDIELFARELPAGQRVIAITGSNGKSTVTRLISHILLRAGRHVGMTTSDGILIDERMVDPGDWTGPAGAQAILRRNDIVAAPILVSIIGAAAFMALGLYSNGHELPLAHFAFGLSSVAAAGSVAGGVLIRCPTPGSPLRWWWSSRSSRCRFCPIGPWIRGNWSIRSGSGFCSC